MLSIVEKSWVDFNIEFAKRMLEENGVLHGVLLVGNLTKNKGSIVAIHIDAREPFTGLRKSVSAHKARIAADMIGATISMSLHEGWMLDPKDTESVKDYMKNRDKYPDGLASHPNKIEVMAVGVEMLGQAYAGYAKLYEKEIDGKRVKTFDQLELGAIPFQHVGGRFCGILSANRKKMKVVSYEQSLKMIEDAESKCDDVSNSDDMKVVDFNEFIRRRGDVSK